MDKDIDYLNEELKSSEIWTCRFHNTTLFR